MKCIHQAWAVLAILTAICGEARAGRIVPTPLPAGQFNRIVAFGDSGSDTGNLYAMASYPPAPYYNGRFCNGPVWVEDLAELIHVPPPNPVRRGGATGTNYAYGGAKVLASGFQLIPTIPTQINTFLAQDDPRPGDLITVFAGYNDFAAGQRDAAAVANALLNQLPILAGAGAKDILVLNLPAMGQTPGHRGTADEALFDGLAVQFNNTLANGLASMAPSLGGDVTIHTFDMYAACQGILAHPAPFTNITDPALISTSPARIVPNPDEYVFWDDTHLTRAAQRMIAEAIVPEPGVLATGGAVAFWCLLRRRRAA